MDRDIQGIKAIKTPLVNADRGQANYAKQGGGFCNANGKRRPGDRNGSKRLQTRKAYTEGRDLMYDKRASNCCSSVYDDSNCGLNDDVYFDVRNDADMLPPVDYRSRMRKSTYKHGVGTQRNHRLGPPRNTVYSQNANPSSISSNNNHPSRCRVVRHNSSVVGALVVC